MDDNKAPSFEMPNEAGIMAHAKPYYGNQYVPHPTNSAAKIVNHPKVMKQVMEAKQMKCYSCNYPDTRVVYTDKHDFRDLIKRRRECLRCGARFTTHEEYRDQSLPKDVRTSQRK